MFLCKEEKSHVGDLKIEIEEEIVNHRHTQYHDRHREDKQSVNTELLYAKNENILNVNNQRNKTDHTRACAHLYYRAVIHIAEEVISDGFRVRYAFVKSNPEYRMTAKIVNSLRKQRDSVLDHIKAEEFCQIHKSCFENTVTFPTVICTDDQSDHGNR